MVGFICAVIHEPSDREFILWVYGEFKNLMYSTAYKYTSNADTADDIVQDAIVNLIKNVGTIRPMKRYILAGYIMATIRNISINTLKSQAHHRENIAELTDDIFTEALPLDAMLMLTEQKTQLNKIWPQLSEEVQILLEGKYILGYSDQELAKVFKCKPSSIRMKLTRARRKALALLIEEGMDYYDQT